MGAVEPVHLDKSNAGMGSLYRSKHELVFVFKVGRAAHFNAVELGRHGRNRTNVWDYASVNSLAGSRREDLALHPTVKPTALVADAIQDVTRRGDLVLDTFLGSGTTLIACERSGRRFRGVELDPAYVDVAIERWTAMDALMTRVWPDRIVEENNLQAQIVALRKILGLERELIRTISGRGYQFTGEISTASVGAAAGVSAAETSRLTNVPESVSELIGRDDELSEILKLAATHRLLTLTGAGGIGKTRLALSAAHQLLPQFADGAWLAEFSPLAGPGLVASTVAAPVGLEISSGEVSTQRVAQAIAGRRMLLVLDTCEHVIAAAAVMAEAVQRAGSAVHIIATSREPLRAEGEWIYPVPPLAVPAENVEDADDPLQYGAVRLFVERAQAAEPHFAPDRRGASTIAAICRRLDGIPLAIELAASPPHLASRSSRYGSTIAFAC
jgi:hypothetical protein